jgi:non-heme chloroperoxidase
MPYLNIENAGGLFYRDQGTGAPVILIHGWPYTSDMWDKQTTFLLEQGLRVISYDRRGFGRSDQPGNGYDYATMANDLNQLMEHLNLKNSTLVGFSMGGGEVVRYLSLYGTSRVAKAVLVSSVTPYLLRTDDNPDGVEAKVFEEIDEQLRKDRPNFLRSFGQKFFNRTMISHTVSEPVLDWVQSMGLTGSLRSTLATAKSWSTTDFRSEMKAINIPVRIIHGTADATVPIDASGRRSIKLLPNATLTEYDGEPHGLFVTAEDRLNNELLEFIGGRREPISQPMVA